MRAPPKYFLHEIVRIKSQPPARTRLVGEWGVVGFVERGLVGLGPKPYCLHSLDVPPELATNVYLVNLYREGLFSEEFRAMMYCFNEADLEGGGEFDAYFGDEEADKAGRREAARAIARKQLYVCASGGICVVTWGIQESEKKLVAGLPHRLLACGCCSPGLERGHSFAKAFNQEIVKHLLERTP